MQLFSPVRYLGIQVAYMYGLVRGLVIDLHLLGRTVWLAFRRLHLPAAVKSAAVHISAAVSGRGNRRDGFT